MKSRTSFFNGTLFRKNITRFAPVWALYTVLMLLIYFLDVPYLPDWMCETASGLLFAPIYALVCALALFGDLYNPRMCNGLHALPVRRESWFLTNVLSGLSFSVVPNLLLLLLALGALAVNGIKPIGYLIPLAWFAGMSLSFLYFFSVAVLSAFLVGRRFAQAAVYGILNFLPMLLCTLAREWYEPVLYGIRIPSEPFTLLCPAVTLPDGKLLDYRRMDVEPPLEFSWLQDFTLSIGDGWPYLLTCAVLAFGILALALMLYRRRKLETAGDFLSLKQAEPVFLVIFSLCFVIILNTFGVFGNLLILPLVVGFFAGLMLMKRTVRVFNRKSFLGCGALVLAVFLSVLITWLDPLGLVERIPEPENVESVTLYYGNNNYKAPGNSLTLTEPEDIQTIRQLHEMALCQEVGNTEQDADGMVTLEPDGTRLPYEELSAVDYTLEYRLRDGSTLRRYYTVWVQSASGKSLKSLFSRPECVLGVPEDQVAALAAEIEYIKLSEFSYVRMPENIQTLLEAIAADCAEGTMVQPWGFRRGVKAGADALSESNSVLWTLEFCILLDDGVEYWHLIDVYDTCENTCLWLNQNYKGIQEGKR